MKSNTTVGKSSLVVKQQPSENFGGMGMKSATRHSASVRRFARATINWVCAAVCVLFLFCSAAQAQSITGFLVNGVSSSTGPIGATLTIQGSGFGASQGFNTATLNGTALAGNGVKANSWTNTSIVVVIPTNATSGPVVVKVSGRASNSVNFAVAPAITSVSPASGERGTAVTISGNNFSAQTGNTVTFNGVTTTPSSWTSSKIVAPVPWTTTGKVMITVAGAQSNGVNFAISAPPPAGTPGTGTFFVNRTDDPAVPVDASGNPLLTQFCRNTSNTDTSSPCSLREAVVEANGDANDSTTSPDTIMLASGTYHLSITGTGTLNATTGHLDITNAMTIVGAGTSTTIVQADLSLQDQIFLIDAAEEGSIGFPVALSNLTIQGGQVNPNTGLVTSGGAFLWEAGTNGTGLLRLTNVNINGNTATDAGDPGVDDGGAMALFNTASVTTPAQVTITGSTIQNNQALDAGGGIALKGAISLNMSSSIVTGNKAIGGGIQEGGGLFFCVCNNAPLGATSSPSSIQNSTISANTAGSGSLGEGGGLWTDQALTISQGSVLSGNSAGGAGGGIATALSGASDQVVISSSSITNNTTSGSGGGIEIDGSSNANLNLSFNRIVGNTASGGNGLASLGTGTVSATDNWWGCNQGPQTSSNGCDTVSGTITSSPWILFTNTASPSAVLNGSPTTLTASFLQNSSGGTLSASNLTPLIGLTVSYPRTANGALSQQQTTIQSTGTATATLTTSGTPTASSDVQIDHATATANVTIQDFSVNPSAATLTLGSTTGALTVTVSAVNGFSGVVTLGCGTLPAGITCPAGSFNPPTITGSGTSTLTVNIASGVGAGTYSIPVTGTISGVSRSGSGSVTLADFAISLGTPTILGAGLQITYPVTCSTSTGFNGAVQLSTSVAGATTGFSVNPLTCPGTSQLTINITSVIPTSFTVTGTSGSAVRTASANLPTQSSATINISGTLQTAEVCNWDGLECAQPDFLLLDFGSINVAIGSCAVNGVGWDNDAFQTATDVAANINVTCTNVTVSSVTSVGGGTGANITVKSKGVGTTTNYGISTSSVDGGPQFYAGPPDGTPQEYIFGGSYTVSAPPAMSGGHN